MSISISEMYCTECGKKGIDIPRKVGKEREAGHLKSLYCINCKKVTNHAEVRPFGKYNKEDFLIEFENGKKVAAQNIVYMFKDGSDITFIAIAD